MVQYTHDLDCHCDGDWLACLDKGNSWPPKDFSAQQKARWRSVKRKNYFKKYYEENGETIRNSASEWFSENKDRKLLYCQARRKRLKLEAAGEK